MKNKSYRLLSLLLSILVLVSACICPTVVNAGTGNITRETKVLHFQANNKGPLGQRVTVTEGETYVFGFSLSNGIDFTVDLFDKNTRNKAKNATTTQISAEDKGEYTEYVYEILVPDIFTETSDQVFVGLQFANKTTDGYFFNASLYNKADANKTEMFLNGDFSLGNLNNWCWRWNKTSAGGDQTSGTFTHGDGDVYLEVVNFKDTPIYDTTRVLHFQANNKGPLGQRVTVTEGETYVFGFSLSNGIDFTVDLFDKSTRNKAKNATATQISAEDKGEYTEYVYEILVPDIFTETSDQVFVGLQFANKTTDGYFFNASLYNKADANKTEMFLNGDFSLGNLNNWCWRWNKTSAGGDQTSGTFTHGDGDVYLEVVDIKDTLIYDTTRVLHFQANNKGPLGQRVTVTEGETYVFGFSLSNGIDFTVDLFDKNTRNKAKNATTTQISAEDKGEYTEYVYEILVPDIFTETSDQVFVGLQFANKTTDGYFFNASLYNKADANKTEMFLNGDFSLGNLNNWCWRWNKTSAGGDQTSGTFTHGDGDVYLEVMIVEDTPIYDESFMPATTPDKMVEITSNSKGPFGTQINVTAGETYTFKFGISDGLNFNVVMHDKDSRHQSIGATATLKNSDDSADGYTYYEYEVTVPSTYTKSIAVLGISFTGTAPYEGYFFDATAYKTSDAEKTELLANGKFAEGYLNNWVWKYHNFGASANLTEETFTEDSKEVTVKVVDFDETLMQDNTPEPGPSAHNMVHITSANKGPFGSQIAVTAGETYTFKFGVSNALNFNVVMHDKDSRHQSIGATATLKNSDDKGGYTYYEYEVTVPSTYTKSIAVLGISFTGTAPYEGYFFDATAYKTSDAEKTELLANGKFAEGYLNNWVWKYHNFGASANLTEETFTEDSKEVTVKVVDFDETLMPDTSPKMLHINSQNAGPLGQLITAKAGETYTITFAISNNAKFDVVTNDGSSRHKPINSKVEFVSGEDKGRYAIWTYDVTMPDDLTEKANNVLLGIKFKGTEPYDCYLFDVLAYESTDAEKTNLFKNGDFMSGVLDSWRFKYTNIAAGLANSTFPEDSKSVTLEVMKFDETKMADVAAELPDLDPKMLHINSQNAGPLGQLITAKAGETYTITFAISNNAKFDVVTNDGSTRHKPINSKVEFVSGEDKGRYAIWTYNVTMPDDLTETTNNVLLGIKFNGTAPYDCYLFDVLAYESSDAEKTNLFKNGDFMSGVLDSWRFKYTNIAAGLANSTFTEDSKSVTLEVMKFDETKMADVAAEFPDLDPKMLHIQTNHTGPLNQQVTVEGGETYIYKFTASNSLKFDVVVVDNDKHHVATSGVEIEFIEGQDAGKYATWTYKITMPETIISEKTKEETNIVRVGLKLKGTAPYDGYVLGASFYKESDNSATNQLKNRDFFSGELNNWTWKAKGLGTGQSKYETTEYEDGDKKYNLSLEVVKFDESVMQSATAKFPPKVPQMVHITGEGTGPFFQQVTVEPGQKYTMNVTISNNVKFDVIVNKQSAITVPVGAEIKFVDGVDKGKYSVWTYEITMPQVIMNGDTKNGEKETTAVLVGIQLKGATSFDGYLAGVSLYNSSDNNKTELFKNGNFANGCLDYWRWRYQNYSSNKGLWNVTFKEKEGETEKETTLEVVDFDVNKMADATAKFPPKVPQMLHITGTSTGPFFQQVTVEPGQKYTMNVTISNNVKFDVIVNKQSAITTAAGAEIAFVDGVDKGKYSVWTYEITMPQVIMNGDTKKGEKETTAVLVGIQLKGATSFDGYLADVSLYKSSDKNKTELFKNGDFANGSLDYWRWRYQNYSSNKGISKANFTETEGVTEKETTLEVVDFDVNKMADATAKFQPKVPQMLHIVTDHAGPLGQIVSLEAGETYTFTFAISNNASFDVAVNDGDKRHSAVSAKIDYVGSVDKGRYAIWTYTIKMPDNLSSKNVLLGIKLKGPKNEKGQYDCYFADALLYKTSDTTKKNILKNADFSIGALDSWNWKYQRDTAGKSLYEKRFTDGKNDSGQDLYYNVLLEVMNFDESKMAQASAVMPDHSKKMIYFKNGAITQSFAAWVDCQPGDKFIVSYSIFATDEVVPHFNRNGLRGNVNGNPELLSEVKNGNYTTYTYKMTVPEDYDDDLIFLGLKMPFYAEGYIFDLEAYKDGDANKKSVWKNGDFVYGFNDWIWGWTVTWFTQAGNQLKEWSDGMNEIKIVPYDLSLIDALVAEINRDDGEWWKPTDIIESAEEEQGIGTIKGTFTDQDGKPIAKVKLILKSDSRTYTTLTNKKGEFEFKDIEADYYELYYVNSKGEEVLTSFSYGLSNGDTVTLKIVTDTSKLGKAPVSGLSGTLYTPDLETVANLKIYLRGFGETVTDKDGNFSFGDVPVGTYELYTILEDGTEYVFRTVEIKENIDLGIKVKYDPESVISTTQDNSNQGLSYWIWIIIGCGGVVLVSGGLVTTLLILKKKRKAIK